MKQKKKKKLLFYWLHPKILHWQVFRRLGTDLLQTHKSFQLIWMEFGVLLRLVGAINLILSCPFDIQGREPDLCDVCFNKNQTLSLYSDIYRLICFQTWYDYKNH